MINIFILSRQSGVLLSYILWSVSYTFPIFILARIVSGLSKGIVSISAALVTDVTSSADRSKAMVRCEMDILTYKQLINT